MTKTVAGRWIVATFDGHPRMWPGLARRGLHRTSNGRGLVLALPWLYVELRLNTYVVGVRRYHGLGIVRR